MDRSYYELVLIVQTIVKFDENKYSADLQSLSIVLWTTCRTFIRNNDNTQFMLVEDRVIPQVCVSLIERSAGGVIGEDIPDRDNTQQFRSSGGSNQLFTERSGINGWENICVVPPEVAAHDNISEPQIDDVFGCQIEMNGRQYNHQYNEIYNDINNEQNTTLNVGVIHEVDNEGNFNSVQNVEDNQDDNEPVETERCVRHVHRFSSSTPDIAGTSEGRANVTPDDSDNATTWVIPGAELYSFGIGGSRNLVVDEPTSMIYKEQFFPTKKDLKRLVGHFAMRQNFEWKVKRSNKTTLHLVCLMGNCTWKLRAVRRDEGTYFQVRSFVNEHTCLLEKIHRRHRQASAVIIGEVIAPRLQQQDGRLMSPKDIIVDMKSMYGIQIMYSKAHAAHDYALSLTYGKYEETFQRLPSFGYVLEQQNPCTITNLQCDEDGKFLHFFMSIGASLRGFRTCMRPVIAVDDKAARAYTEFEYNQHMEELRNLHQNAYDYVIDAGPYKWSRVHCPERRYRVMTTNVVECINSCLKFACQLPMLTLAEFIKNMLQRWFHDRYRAAQTMRHQLTDATHLVLLKRVEKCGFFTVNPVDLNIFSVKRSGKQWTVDLARKTCTCNKFQNGSFSMFSHSYGGTVHYFQGVLDRNWDLTTLCSDYYKRQTLIDAYWVPIMPVGHPSTWVVPSDIAQRVILNPNSRRQAGRPRAGLHVSSSERTTTQSCRRCGQPGHNSRRCSNPPMINEGTSRGVPDEYRRTCSICHLIGHNKQTCPNIDSNRE
ncbi:hypothetical protein Ddye_012482 [Dipteronia dyeriana]|uniref:CCHC-type domain-containing protein n=1 Tax=Dipteronia dyeriana TaxID=168575 RepID=A0AAD9X4M4_9ROSI|nr:hypothetical protein Ddye_012482 [Dipteronia dyeriana]